MKASANEYTTCIAPAALDCFYGDIHVIGTCVVVIVVMLFCVAPSARVNRVMSAGLHRMQPDLSAFLKCMSQLCYCTLILHSATQPERPHCIPSERDKERERKNEG